MSFSLYLFLSFCMVATLLHLLSSQPHKKLPTVPTTPGWIIACILAVAFGLADILLYDDKWVYLQEFYTVTTQSLSQAKDFGWTAYIYLIKQIISNPVVFFILTAGIYISGFYVFAKHFFEPRYRWYFLIATFLSFAFDAYAVNVIRSGMGLSFALMALSQYKNRPRFIFFVIIAILFHKTMVIPFVAFLFAKKFDNSRLFLNIWLFCLVLSALNVSFISGILQTFFDDSDRFALYIEGGTPRAEAYKTGFRIDFIIYSLIPILIARYYIFKLKVEDLFYKRIFNTYLIVNALWLLVVRIPFTDRVAFLSWFLIPMLLLYPLLKYELPIKQRYWVFYILLGIFSFTSFMYLK